MAASTHQREYEFRRTGAAMKSVLKSRLLRYALAIAAILAVIVAGCALGRDGSSDEALPPTTTVVGNTHFVGCLECHSTYNEIRAGANTVLLAFDHDGHDARLGDSACGSCHPVETHEDLETVRPSMDACFTCHGAQAADPLPCSSCHPLSVVPRPPSHMDHDWDVGHGVGLIDAEPECTSCHAQEQFCTGCHGVEMPHPVGWIEAEHAHAFFETEEEGCGLCHVQTFSEASRSDCDTCHHPTGATDEPWLLTHPEAVRHEGGGDCFTCHDPQTCVVCHRDGVRDFEADWAMIQAVGE